MQISIHKCLSFQNTVTAICSITQNLQIALELENLIYVKQVIFFPKSTGRAITNFAKKTQRMEVFPVIKPKNAVLVFNKITITSDLLAST